MDVGVRDVATFFNVSEKTVYRWIKDSKLPAFKIGEQYRFNRAELLEWATLNRVNVAVEIFSDPQKGQTPPTSFEESLAAGGIHYRVGGTDKVSVLEAAIKVMPLPQQVDRNFLLKVMIARESLGSTGIGEGIAIPHVRNPIVLHVPKPMISVCFLEHPIDFDAIDGQPVHTLFAIVSPMISAHLGLLSKLAFALRQPDFGKAIREQGTREEIFSAAHAIDTAVARKADRSEGKMEM